MSKTPIQEFYTGQTILITGATGFIGKVLIERLLRQCYDLEKMYLVVREKRNKTPEERFKEIFDFVCFDNLKKEKPNFLEKLTLIEGDCERPNIGIKEHERAKLINEVTCIFHGAATVNFDEKLSKATNINIRAVENMLHLAKAMPKLRAFVHISTAYSHCERFDIGEKFYQTPMKAHKLYALLDAVDDDTLNDITPRILGKWPNTYTFTKAIAEDIIKDEGVEIPLAIVRPSILVSSYKDPLPGWIDNLYGAAGGTIGGYVGLVRSINASGNNRLNIMPCDYAVNNIICSAWDIEQKWLAKVNRSLSNEMLIYNVTTADSNILPLDKFHKILYEAGCKYPTRHMIWHYGLTLRPNPLWHKICAFFVHTMFSYFLDTLSIITGSKPTAVKIYKKVDRYIELTAYFALNHFTFDMTNNKLLWNKMSEDDKRIFNFNTEDIDWDYFLTYCIIGARIYVLKDPLDTLPQARRKRYFFAILHYSLQALLFYLIYRLVYFILQRFYT